LKLFLIVVGKAANLSISLFLFDIFGVFLDAQHGWKLLYTSIYFLVTFELNQ